MYDSSVKDPCRHGLAKHVGERTCVKCGYQLGGIGWLRAFLRNYKVELSEDDIQVLEQLIENHAQSQSTKQERQVDDY